MGNPPRPLASRRVDAPTSQQTLQTSQTSKQAPRGRVYPPARSGPLPWSRLRDHRGPFEVYTIKQTLFQHFRFSAPPSPNAYTSNSPSELFWMHFSLSVIFSMILLKCAPRRCRKHNSHFDGPTACYSFRNFVCSTKYFVGSSHQCTIASPRPPRGLLEASPRPPNLLFNLQTSS